MKSRGVDVSQKIKESLSTEQQLDLDLGDAFRGWIDPFLKKEPLHVLGLSSHAEKTLIANGKTQLTDLIEVNLQEFVFIKGMGQGHIDEIQQKLTKYLEGKPLKKAYKIDFSSWIRSLCSLIDRKKIYVTLAEYDLNDLISLTPAENVEVRRLTVEKKSEWIEEVSNLFKKSEQKTQVLNNMEKIVNVFIRPWMRRRHGFARESELQERLQMCCEQPEITKNALNFFSNVYYQSKFPLEDHLIEVSAGLFCSDSFFLAMYQKITKKAQTYFYKTDIHYTLEELVFKLHHEFSLSWESFPSGTVYAILRLSPLFRVRKNARGSLEIRLY